MRQTCNISGHVPVVFVPEHYDEQKYSCFPCDTESEFMFSHVLYQKIMKPHTAVSLFSSCDKPDTAQLLAASCNNL